MCNAETYRMSKDGGCLRIGALWVLVQKAAKASREKVMKRAVSTTINSGFGSKTIKIP